MSVRIRMKKMGRKHRPFFRICAMDIREPRDGRVLEELGTYDPMVPETDARAMLNGERINYWLSVGAQPSDKVQRVDQEVRRRRDAPGGSSRRPGPAGRRAAAGPSRRADAACRRSRPKPARGRAEPRPRAAASRRRSSRRSAAQKRPRCRSSPRRTRPPPNSRADRSAMRFDVLTLFPEIFQGYLGQSLLKRAIERGPGRRAPAQHPRLVARTNTTRSTIAPSAAGPAWC